MQRNILISSKNCFKCHLRPAFNMRPLFLCLCFSALLTLYLFLSPLFFWFLYTYASLLLFIFPLPPLTFSAARPLALSTICYCYLLLCLFFLLNLFFIIIFISVPFRSCALASFCPSALCFSTSPRIFCSSNFLIHYISVFRLCTTMSLYIFAFLCINVFALLFPMMRPFCPSAFKKSNFLF